MARVINRTRGTVVAERVEVAASFFRRFLGLIGRRGWGDRDGLWIEPCSGVHGMGIRFPIDVILLDEGLRALWIGPLRPWSLGRVHLDARAAIELPGGAAVRSRTARGDALALER